MRIAATLANILAPAPKKASSVRAAMRSVHGLTAETVIGALEAAKITKRSKMRTLVLAGKRASLATIIGDYDAQS